MFRRCFLFAPHKNKHTLRTGGACNRPWSLTVRTARTMKFFFSYSTPALLALPARGLLLSIETKVTKSSPLSTAREVAEIGVSPRKSDYRLHRAYNNSPALPPHRTQNPLSKTHTLLCPAISKVIKKSFCPLSDADFFCKEKGFLNSWVYIKLISLRRKLEGQHKPNRHH